MMRRSGPPLIGDSPLTGALNPGSAQRATPALSPGRPGRPRPPGGFDSVERAQLEDEALPPLRPAACFWARLPPLPLPLRLLPPPPKFLPPLLEALGLLAIAAARLLLMPFLRRPSYCLSSLTLEP